MTTPSKRNLFDTLLSRPPSAGSKRQLLSWLALAGMVLLQPLVPAQQLQWIPQGAAPNLHGQVENIDEGEVSGGIQAVALDPIDANTVYVGSVNGGLWKSVNAMGANPTWQQLTDDQNSLSIGAVEIDPTDSTSQTIVVGMGRFSSLAQAGGPRAGLLRSINGGKSWLQIGNQLKGLNISGVAPRGQTIVVSANDADDPRNAGIWRMTGGSWVKISGRPGTGLPEGACASLASDPTTLGRLYANAGTAGLFKTENTGATWSKISDPTMDNLLSTADNLKISVGLNGSVYVAIDVGGHLAGVFYSANSGTAWTTMDLPGIEEGGVHPGGQGYIHLAIAADPKAYKRRLYWRRSSTCKIRKRKGNGPRSIRSSSMAKFDWGV